MASDILTSNSHITFAFARWRRVQLPGISQSQALRPSARRGVGTQAGLGQPGRRAARAGAWGARRAHRFRTRRSPSPGSGTGQSRRRVTASRKLGLSRVTTSFCIARGMEEPWKSRKWRAYDMSTMARAPAGTSRSIARASARFLRRRWPGSRPARADRLGSALRGRAERAGPPLLRPAPSPRLPPFPTTPGSRSPLPPRRAQLRESAQPPWFPGAPLPGSRPRTAAAPAAAPLIFLFWFESARRRLAKDPLRPPPSSWRPGGTGYPHPPQALKAGFDSSERVRGAARGRARPATAAAASRRQPRASSERRGSRRPAQAPPLPVRSVHFLARWYESTPSAAGAAGHGRGPCRAGSPHHQCGRSSTERGPGAPSAPCAPGSWPLGPGTACPCLLPSVCPMQVARTKPFYLFWPRFLVFP